MNATVPLLFWGPNPVSGSAVYQGGAAEPLLRSCVQLRKHIYGPFPTPSSLPLFWMTLGAMLSVKVPWLVLRPQLLWHSRSAFPSDPFCLHPSVMNLHLIHLRVNFTERLIISDGCIRSTHMWKLKIITENIDHAPGAKMVQLTII